MEHIVKNLRMSEFVGHSEAEFIYTCLLLNSKTKKNQLLNNDIINIIRFDSIDIPFCSLEKSFSKGGFQSIEEFGNIYEFSNELFYYKSKRNYIISLGGNYDLKVIAIFRLYNISKDELHNPKEYYTYLPKPISNQEADELLEVCYGVDFIFPDGLSKKEFDSEVIKFTKIIYELIDKEKDFRIIKENKVNIIQYDRDFGYQLVEFEIENDVSNIDKNLLYGKGFNEFYELFIDKLNNSKKGIAIFNGPPGTGKSSFIRSMIKEKRLKDKIVIYTPVDILSNITNTDLINFLKKLKHQSNKKENILFICEDGEELLLKRDKLYSNKGVSSILNFSDGILNDFYNIQIIITHNQENKIIDPAILRHGRLLAIREFNKLNIDDSNNLLNVLNINYDADDAMTLAEIFHKKEENKKNDEILYQGLNKMKNEIGFKFE